MSEEDKDKGKKSKKSKIFRGSNKNILTKILLGITVAGVFLAIPAVIFAGILTSQKQLLIPTTAVPKTTKQQASNSTDLVIGQYCRYNNQCPQNAFCSGTCQCSLNYYFNVTNNGCLQRKTNGANCAFDDECNINLGLECSTTCKCDSEHFWNSTYVISGNLPLGRCQSKKLYGMACSGSEGNIGMNYANYFGSQIRRCWCENGWAYYLNPLYGRCQYNNMHNHKLPCQNSFQCHYAYAMCMDLDGDGVKHCEIAPTLIWYQSFRWRLDYTNTGCSASYRCNDWKNLMCRANVSSNIATCLCFDEFYYWNTTMCVLGNKYGEPCSSSSQCVPSTAGFVCDYPYSGALQTVCRCVSGTQYLDLQTNKCTAFKTLNSTCRDSTECSGSSTDSMFCGHYNGGSHLVCLCTDAYYASGSTCVAKLAYNTVCSTTAQCMEHLNQICLTSTTGRCGCATGRYYDSSDYRCKYLKYQRDNCTLSTECWSGTCTTSLCS